MAKRTAPHPGNILANHTIDVFLKTKGVCWEELYLLETQSPAHVDAMKSSLEEVFSPTDIEESYKQAFIDPENYANKFISFDLTKKPVAGTFAKAKNKNWKKELEANHVDKTLLKNFERDNTITVFNKVMSDESVSSFFDGYYPDVKAYWVDPDTNLECKSDIDIVCPDGKTVAFVLPIDKASPKYVAYAVTNEKMHIRFAFALRGLREITGRQSFTKAVVIAVEKTTPLEYGVYDIDNHSLVIANNKVTSFLKTYKECKDSGVWSGYHAQSNKNGLLSLQLNKHYV